MNQRENKEQFWSGFSEPVYWPTTDSTELLVGQLVGCCGSYSGSGFLSGSSFLDQEKVYDLPPSFTYHGHKQLPNYLVLLSVLSFVYYG